MAFEASAKSFYLEGGHILVAEVSDTDGDYVNATIDLDKYIGNEDGWFMWGGVDFSDSANDIRLEGTLLTAELPMRDGGYRERQGIDLNECITNNNGELIYQPK